MNPIKNIALFAHDSRKQDLLSWLREHKNRLTNYPFFTSDTTGDLIEQNTALTVNRVTGGPEKEGQKITTLMSEGKVDLLIFFWDPLEPVSLDPNMKTLLHSATRSNIPTASNKSTVDFIMNSILINDCQLTG